MQPLSAPERPISHFRHGRMAAASAGDGARPRPPAATADTAPPAPAERRAARAPGILSRLLAPRPAADDRRDPAPSRLSYRMERLWLTPRFRFFIRFGLPVLLVGAVAGLWLADGNHRAAISSRFAELRTRVENRPEFMVRLMSVEGASSPVADAVRAMVTVPLPASSFQLDLEAMRAAIEQIDAVQSARLMIKAGGILSVEITERSPAILWRTEASLEMLDATGHRVATLLDRGARPDLPLIAGVGADLHVPEALAVLTAAQPILSRVRGLVWMGDRRWDIILDGDQRVQLPSDGAVVAVERLIAIDQAEDLLARDVSVVDLRNPDRPTLRVNAVALTSGEDLTETVTQVADE